MSRRKVPYYVRGYETPYMDTRDMSLWRNHRWFQVTVSTLVITTILSYWAGGVSADWASLARTATFAFLVLIGSLFMTAE